MSAILIRGGTVVTARGGERIDLLVRDGMIAKGAVQDAKAKVIDASDHLVLPGLIDCHVHFREPGFETKGTMESEAGSARAGGITTVCDMPNTNPPTTSIAALEDKVKRATKAKNCDIRFFFGAMEREHLKQLEQLWTADVHRLLKGRCAGLKVYLDHSTGNQGAGKDVVEEAFQLCAALRIPLVVHCEDAKTNEEARENVMEKGINAHSLMRPPESEERAVASVIALARKHGALVHATHLSTAQGLALIRQAKKDGIAVTCDVAPHHLFLSVDDYAALGARAKMNPPLRTREHQEALWGAIADGTVDCIATDHAPHTREEKDIADPLKAPSGVPGVETLLPLLLTVAAGEWPHPTSSSPVPHLRYEDIVRLCFTNPNKIFSLRREDITEGARTPLVIVDPKGTWTITAKTLHAKCGWTPYEGWRMTGGVREVL